MLKQITTIEQFLDILPLVKAFALKSDFKEINVDSVEFLQWIEDNLSTLKIYAAYDNNIPIGYIMFELMYNYYLKHVFVFQVYIRPKDKADMFKSLVRVFAKEHGVKKIRMITGQGKLFERLHNFKFLGNLMEMEA